MVFQYPTIASYPNANGIMPLLFSLRDAIPGAFQAMLIFILIILFAGNYFLVRSKTGRAKILVALLAPSIVMIPLSLMLALAQLVPFVTVLFYGFFAIIAFILFEISDTS